MRILVLEKKPMVSLIPKMLSHHNYEADVEYTSDLSEAMRWYSTRAPYDVVLAGLFGANGLPLAEYIRQNNPSQVVGIMTGFEGEELPRSEERRVGKECRRRWSPYHSETKSRRHRSARRQ